MMIQKNLFNFDEKSNINGSKPTEFKGSSLKNFLK